MNEYCRNCKHMMWEQEDFEYKFGFAFPTECELDKAPIFDEEDETYNCDDYRLKG